MGPLPKGYHYEGLAYLEGFLDEAEAVIVIIADSGADGATVSKKAVERLVYLQKEAAKRGKLHKPKGVCNFRGLMKPIKYMGFMGEKGGLMEVHLVCTLRFYLPSLLDDRPVVVETTNVRVMEG